MRKNMAYDYSDLISDVEGWAQQAVKQGWIDKADAMSLVEEQEGSANALFVDKNARPLVVAFMGGTGVGKSSLLNKLAGQSIARTGVERPTSREVTLYYHQSVDLHQLEEQFPLQQIQLSQHTETAHEKIIWIDMPDFDSTEEKNKDIVMQWLPYVDVLIYVVSPERYRDNKAWQLLLSQGASHAWLFVMNQWDRGETSQYEDFKQQLAKAGFLNPIIYKTSCIDELAQTEDELIELQVTIESLATEKTIEQLESRGAQQRKNNLQHRLQQCLPILGSEQAFSRLLEFQYHSWSQTETILNQGFEWPLKQAAMAYSKTGSTQKQDGLKLWDDWAQSRFNDYLDYLIFTADQQGLPNIPIRTNLVDIRSKAESIIHTQAELGCRQSLINPGNLLQRMLLKLVHFCEIMLPLIAMTVVGYQVFQGYYDSSFTDEAFLGVNFAVHSLLLILLSWLVPYFIRKKIQPSLEKAALKGLYKGVEIAMTTIDIDVKQGINNVEKQHHKITDSLRKIIEICEEQQQGVGAESKSEELKRMLVE
jgi:predicted GTPase